MSEKLDTTGMCTRERLLQYGAEQISDAELLALVLRSSVQSAVQLMEEFGSLRSLVQAGTHELCQTQGIGIQRVAILKAVLSLGQRLHTVSLHRGQSFTSSHAVYLAYHPRVVGLEQETFWVLLLDTRNRIIREIQVALGSVNRCPLSTQDIFAPALREKAVRLILIHNHPSGNPEPSQDDRTLTQRLKQCASLLGLEILDHIVIGDGCYVSFADRGWM